MCNSKHETVWYWGNIAEGRDEDLVVVTELPQYYVNAEISSQSEHSITNLLWINLIKEYSGYYSCVYSNDEDYMHLYDMVFIEVLEDSADFYRISRGREVVLNLNGKSSISCS